MSARTLVVVALGFVVIAALAALVGGGEGVSILSGTVPPSGASGIFLGLVDALAYFAAVVLSPILLLAAAAVRLREWVRRPVR